MTLHRNGPEDYQRRNDARELAAEKWLKQDELSHERHGQERIAADYCCDGRQEALGKSGYDKHCAIEDQTEQTGEYRYGVILLAVNIYQHDGTCHRKRHHPDGYDENQPGPWDVFRPLAQQDDIQECAEKKLQRSVTIASCIKDIIARSRSRPKPRRCAGVPDYEIVQISQDGPLLDVLRDRPTIGLDTEFMREKTFFAELCLVQIAVGDTIFCADPLTDSDQQPFWNALMPCRWVVHSARQDIEVIYQAARQMPTYVFDTQIAAALLGYLPQMGYANMVAELFDVQLAKSHTRANWSRRPLASAAVRYAAEDVEYLLPAYRALSERLERLGRLGWAEQDSAELLRVSLYDSDPQQAIRRLKGAKNLRGPARTAARGLAAWREREALRLNRPRQWIMKDSILLEIALGRPRTKADLIAVPGAPERTVRRAADELLEIVATAAEQAHGDEPPPRPDEKQKSLLKEMQKAAADCAEEFGIATEVVASRKDLSAALGGDRELRIFRGWRRELVGDRLLDLLG